VAAPESLGARRAALLIHGLPAAVRDGVLARLSGDDTARLQPLLDDLRQIGVPASLSQELQWHLAGLAPLPHGATARQRAASLPGADVARALENCSPATVAALLRIAEWPWTAELLDRCGELRRARIHQHLRHEARAPSPGVAEALCERLCREIGSPWTR
jgi:hypothetical protein